MRQKVICIDFDGTTVSNDFPKIGKDIGSIKVLKKLIVSGTKLILLTIRDGKTLKEAINFYESNDIILYGVNKNPDQKDWNTSSKVFCDLYIDDLGIGCPLKIDEKISDKPFVDWIKTEKFLIKNGFINKDLSEGIINRVLKVYDFYDVDEIYHELSEDNDSTSNFIGIDNNDNNDKNDNTNLDWDFDGRNFNLSEPSYGFTNQLLVR